MNIEVYLDNGPNNDETSLKRLIKPGSKSSLNQAVNFDFPL